MTPTQKKNQILYIDQKPVQRYTITKAEKFVYIEFEKWMSWDAWVESDENSPNKYESWHDLQRAWMIARSHDMYSHKLSRKGEVISVVSPYGRELTAEIMTRYFKGETKKWKLD